MTKLPFKWHSPGDLKKGDDVALETNTMNIVVALMARAMIAVVRGTEQNPTDSIESHNSPREPTKLCTSMRRQTQAQTTITRKPHERTEPGANRADTYRTSRSRTQRMELSKHSGDHTGPLGSALNR